MSIVITLCVLISLLLLLFPLIISRKAEKAEKAKISTKFSKLEDSIKNYKEK